MKTIYLMRHAKAVQEPGLPDFDRALMDKGKRDAERMASRLVEEGLSLNAVISSPAARALETAQIVSDVLDYPMNEIIENISVYEDQGEAELLQIVRGLHDEHGSALICGHNPGISEFAERLMGDFGQWMPTAAIVGVRFSCESWSDVESGAGDLVYFDYPKRDREMYKTMRADLEEAMGSVVSTLYPDASEKKSEAIKSECKKAAKAILERWGISR